MHSKKTKNFLQPNSLFFCLKTKTKFPTAKFMFQQALAPHQLGHHASALVSWSPSEDAAIWQGIQTRMFFFTVSFLCNNLQFCLTHLLLVESSPHIGKQTVLLLLAQQIPARSLMQLSYVLYLYPISTVNNNLKKNFSKKAASTNPFIYLACRFVFFQLYYTYVIFSFLE